MIRNKTPFGAPGLWAPVVIREFIMADTKKKPAGKPTPLQIVKNKFGGKEALAKEIAPHLIRKEGESQEDLVKRLKGQSNTVLLHLYEVNQKIAKLGGREKVADEILKKYGHATKGVDKDYRARLLTYSSARLLDMLKSSGRKLA
ncbi:MAG: hypothetical protein GMKNLPBB_02252 [Myxococcota bacterium]|nr:hypothetical protein [Myxococcota bacterium]